MTRDDVVSVFEPYAHGTEGIGAWLTKSTSEEITKRLVRMPDEPLSKVQLNQLLVLGNEAPVSDAFFHYYWLRSPLTHPYPVSHFGFSPANQNGKKVITSLEHLRWGLHRLYVDGLLYFGNVRTAYRQLRSMSRDELRQFFRGRQFPTRLIRERGPALPMEPIAKDDRYLISEFACKSYGADPVTSALKKALFDTFKAHKALTGGRITIKDLLQSQLAKPYESRQQEFLFSADEVLGESVDSEKELELKFETIAMRFERARKAALKNTNYYLSMVSDLDVYVATSMRSRSDFRKMADICEEIFADPRLRDLQLRYFDPTMSAAAGHEDKGLIECLMVKCAKVLVYCAGEKESYGKDAEAAMALSLGKPVIFLCESEDKARFYREIHPLCRLIEFSTGVAVGAMVTSSLEDVKTLLYRLFENKMEYTFEKAKENHLRLRETLTGSVVRLQTSDKLLAETFWNHYHNKREY